VIWAKSHLAKCYRIQGRLNNVLQLQVQVHALRKQLLGSEHAHVLWDLSDLPKRHRDLGHLAQACRLEEDSVRLNEEVLGPRATGNRRSREGFRFGGNRRRAEFTGVHTYPKPYNL
jgi:hypothetical protein